MTTEKAIEHDIEQARAQLGDTVAQLAAKADVKARAQGAAARLADQIRTGADRARIQFAQVKRQSVQHRQQLTGRPAHVTAVAVVLAVILLARRKRK